jgi:predicted N-acetyltransferase YhbS
MGLVETVESTDRYPAYWPDDPALWLSPKAMLGAWVAETDGRIVGHVALSAGTAATSASVWSEATGLPPEQFASITRLFVSTDNRGVGVGQRPTRYGLRRSSHSRTASSTRCRRD